MVQIEQVPEDLEEAVEVIDLLGHVNASVVLIALILLHCFHRLMELLLNTVENFLQLVKVQTAPRLQLRVVSVAHFR